MPQTDNQPSRVWIGCSWDDVPHLTEKEKAELLDGVSEHMQGVRSTGVPGMGTGLVYPLDPSEYTYDPRDKFPTGIPDDWPRSFGLDFGWNHPTCAIWAAWDRDTDTRYYYSEHCRSKAEVPIHVAAIKARGEWIYGAADPSGGGTSIANGARAIKEYLESGVKLIKANNAVEAGISQCLEDLSVGRAKISTACSHLLMEIRQYHYDKDNPQKVVKEMDDMCDAFRYHTAEYKRISKVKPMPLNKMNIPKAIRFGA